MQKAAAELAQAKQGFDRADELHKRQLIPQQTLDDAETTLRSKQAAYDSALQNAKNLRADIDASNATLKLADRQLRDATIRAPFDGYVQKRLVSLGEFVKSQTPVMTVVRVDPLKADWRRFPSGWRRGSRSASRSICGRRVPGQDRSRHGVAHQPGRQHARRARSRSRRSVPNDERLLKPGTFARVHARRPRSSSRC